MCDLSPNTKDYLKCSIPTGSFLMTGKKNRQPHLVLEDVPVWAGTSCSPSRLAVISEGCHF
ncbi:hypothetical protein ARMGADRAFT_1012365 [Armillaria gallica]|uniref:Uncharacterized protein n=1 Tax=Armillaria gallica TaxID=47427 RepID=A0A2H3DRJ5_ARMGA|nr:hypothetical protein ARMGADRAFT_1012365 [Armillaria gallica]